MSFPAFDVPVIVRAYPATPHLDKQLGVHVQGPQSDLRQARAWTYEAAFSRDSHPPQDRLAVEITFNHPAPGSFAPRSLRAAAPLPPPPPDSFSALAEFVTAYAKISTALDADLRPIEPNASDDEIDQAALALGSFVALADYVAEGMVNEFGFPPVKSMALGSDDGYAFELFEGDDPSADVYVLVIDQPPPSGVDASRVELPGFKTLVCTGKEPWTPAAYQADITADPPTAFAFAFIASDGPPQVLLARDEGRQVRGRTLILGNLDVLARQDGLMSVSVHRNPDLVPGRTTANPFVYTTPPVTFPAPLNPSVVDSRILRIDQLAAGGAVTVASLRAQLAALWDALFAEAPARNTVQCSVHYVYGLGPAGLQAVSLPVLMLPSATFVPPPAQPPASAWTEDALLDALSAQIEAWFAELAPSAGSALTFDQASGSWLSTAGPSGGGLLVLDLVVMASATAMPLLELANLTLPISSVSPPLKTC